MTKITSKESSTPNANKLINTLVISLLGIIAGAIVYLNTQMFQFQKENAKQHQVLIKSTTEEKAWTHSVYEYEIHPNTVRSKDNTKRINKLEKK